MSGTRKNTTRLPSLAMRKQQKRPRNEARQTITTPTKQRRQMFVFNEQGKRQRVAGQSKRKEVREMPPEVWNHVFSLMDKDSLISGICLTSKAWRTLGLSNLRTCTLNPRDDAFAAIRALPSSITSLDLSQGDFGSAHIRLIGRRLPSLTSLKISLKDHPLFAYESVNDSERNANFSALVRAIYALPRLHSLSFSCDQYVQSGAIREILNAIPRHENATLHVLEISMCHELTDNMLSNISPALKQVKFRNCFAVTAGVLELLPRHMRMMKFFQVGEMRDQLISRWIPSFQELVSLDLGFCSDLSDATVALLPSTLRYLNLYGSAGQLTNAALAALPRGLRSLHLSYNTRITDSGLASLPPDLQHLSLVAMSALTLRGMEAKLPRALVVVNIWRHITSKQHRLDEKAFPFLSRVAVFEAPHYFTTVAWQG